MLNIIKKIRKQLLLITAVACCISCKKDVGYKAEAITDTGNLDIVESYFYINGRGTVFYFIPDQMKRNKLFNSNIKEIKLSLGDNVCIAKPIQESMFTHKMPTSDFMFLVEKQSQKVVVDTIEERAVMVLISNEKDINKLIKQEIIRAEVVKN